MIRKCDHTGCTKTGVCRAPKSRDLKEYWLFCKDHAAEYNKNWNYYENMSADEIEADWERQTFGAPLKEKQSQENMDYVNFINDFLTGRSEFDKIPAKKSMPVGVVAALKIFDLPISATLREVQAQYRKLAKTHHPDIAKNKKTAASEFAKISSAYETLKQYFKK